MAKYRKRADRALVVIQGVGALTDDRVIEGDYDRFVPGLLERYTEQHAAAEASLAKSILEAEDASVLENVLAVATAAAGPAGGDQEPDEAVSEAGGGGAEEEDPDMTWRKGDLLSYCEAAGIQREGLETKRELLHLIEEFEGGE